MPMSSSVMVAVTMAVLTLESLPARPLAALASTARTVYVTALDSQGQPVRGLTAADFAVQEGGRDRAIVSVEPARARMRIALAIDEPLMISGEVRQGTVNLIQKLAPQADIGLIVIGLSNRVVVPYTSDAATLIAAIRSVPRVGWGTPTNLAEGIDEIARQFRADEAERPVMVVVAVDGQKDITVPPERVLRGIRDSRTHVNVVAVSLGGISGAMAQVVDGSGLTTILTEGPRQSGGRAIPVTALSAVTGAMGQIATELASQYVLTYSLPEGIRPAERLAVSVKTRGVRLRAPTRVPID